MMMAVKKFLAMKLKVLMPETANLTYRVNKLRSQGLSSRRFATQQARFGMARTRGGNGNVGRVPLDHVPEILTYRSGFSHVLREGLCRLAEGKHHIFCQSLVSIGSSPSKDSMIPTITLAYASLITTCLSSTWDYRSGVMPRNSSHPGAAPCSA